MKLTGKNSEMTLDSNFKIINCIISLGTINNVIIVKVFAKMLYISNFNLLSFVLSFSKSTIKKRLKFRPKNVEQK